MVWVADSQDSTSRHFDLIFPDDPDVYTILTGAPCPKWSAFTPGRVLPRAAAQRTMDHVAHRGLSHLLFSVGDGTTIRLICMCACDMCLCESAYTCTVYIYIYLSLNYLHHRCSFLSHVLACRSNELRKQMNKNNQRQSRELLGVPTEPAELPSIRRIRRAIVLLRLPGLHSK